MLLDALRDFEWYNEPEEVSFDERGVKLTALPHTDFWQDPVRGYRKDNGHFFFARRNGAFIFTAGWRPGEADGSSFAQCGLMGRVDEKHWFKISLVPVGNNAFAVGSVVTSEAGSDMALTTFDGGTAEVWFRLKKSADNVCELSYSVNGIVFYPVRRFYLLCNDNELQTGVFVCSPSDRPYTAFLSSIDFDHS